MKIVIPGNIIAKVGSTEKSVKYKDYYRCEIVVMFELALNPNEYKVIDSIAGLRERGKTFPETFNDNFIDGYELILQKN